MIFLKANINFDLSPRNIYKSLTLHDHHIEELVQRKLDGESYSRIREELAEKGFTEEEVRNLIRQVDERVLRAEIEQGSRERGKTWYRAGMAMAVIGLLLTLGSNAGWILKGVPRWIVYAPFFCGILLLYYGKWLQKKPAGPMKTGRGRIRGKRPYK